MSRVHMLTKTKNSLFFIEVIPKNHVIPIHQHKNKESFHISKGQGYVYSNGILKEVKKNMKIDISPGFDHGLYTKDEPLECFVVIEGDDSEEITKLFWELIKKKRCTRENILAP